MVSLLLSGTSAAGCCCNARFSAPLSAFKCSFIIVAIKAALHRIRCLEASSTRQLCGTKCGVWASTALFSGCVTQWNSKRAADVTKRLRGRGKRARPREKAHPVTGFPFYLWLPLFHVPPIGTPGHVRRRVCVDRRTPPAPPFPAQQPPHPCTRPQGSFRCSVLWRSSSPPIMTIPKAEILLPHADIPFPNSRASAEQQDVCPYRLAPVIFAVPTLFILFGTFWVMLYIP